MSSRLVEAYRFVIASGKEWLELVMSIKDTHVLRVVAPALVAHLLLEKAVPSTREAFLYALLTSTPVIVFALMDLKGVRAGFVALVFHGCSPGA
jgi:hypothetical protein